MTTVEFAEYLDSTGATARIDESRLAYFEDALRELTAEQSPVSERDEGPGNLALALERLALEATSNTDRRALADAAFVYRRTLPVPGPRSTDAVVHLFHLSVDALMAERQAELAMLLRESELDRLIEGDADQSWLEQLLHHVASAFILLCRKQSGWDDVRRASEHVHELRQLQADREADYLDAVGATEGSVASLLVGYNLAKTIDIVASFLIEGQPTDPLIQVERFYGQAERLLTLQPDAHLTAFADALRAGAESLIRGSIWFNTRQLGARFRDFVDEIAGAHRDAPILELWPSQRAALTQNLLNPARRAIVVEMPTSAGKTLIAEFGIIQALALDPEASVAYIVPTRALVNQITNRLRRDFTPLGYQVEAAVPVFELDPTEDALLRQGVDILVLTPEKLDLLLRVGHPAVQKLSLVIADEAHNISEGPRGARLELLLGIIRRERPEARFLLLTPFVPNGDELAAWLGDDPQGRIEVAWRPSERITAAAHFRKRRKGPFELHFRSLPSATNVDLQDEIEVLVGDVAEGITRSKKGITTAAAAALSKRGGVLVLERGRSYAEDRAAEIAELMPERPVDDHVSAVAHYATTELGQGHPLPALLERGVTFHHAGLSHDLRYLIESLIEIGSINVITGTTTLAQGVNFPIASVIVESLQKYVGPPQQWQELSYAEFWNIAGRAGRALQDRLGLVVFPTTSPQDLTQVREYLEAEAVELSSALMTAIAELGDAATEFNLQLVARHPAVAVFLQYLTHALRIAGHESATAELEDILRSSFVYAQARQHNREVAEQLVDLSRRYLANLQGRPSGYLALADGTGFSLSSVDMMFARQRNQHPEFTETAFWNPDTLFSEDLTGLTSVVEILGDIPELSLGRNESGPFNPEIVAGILRDWVHGQPVEEIASSWFQHIESPEDRVRQASLYVYSRLVGQVPWGIGAVQRLALPEDAGELVGHVPSLIFYGVRTREGAQLRMAGVPRIAAEGMADLWRSASTTAETFADVRAWVSERTTADWQAALPGGTPLTGQECRSVWETLSGSSATFEVADD